MIVTKQVATSFEVEVAVIIAFPTFLPVTLPVLSTVATVTSDVFHETVSVDGCTVAINDSLASTTIEALV